MGLVHPRRRERIVSAYDYEPCGLGICAANEGHAGTCAEASGWPEMPTPASHPPSPAIGADNRTTTHTTPETGAGDEGESSE